MSNQEVKINKPLMPKAVASWLVRHTSLSFAQIANFCDLHELEVESIANGISSHTNAINPLDTGELSQEEINRCQENPSLELVYQYDSEIDSLIQSNANKRKGPRSQVPHIVLWFIENYPEMSNSAIAKLASSSAPTVKAIRDKSHKGYSSLKAQNPIILEICSMQDIEKALRRKSTAK